MTCLKFQVHAVRKTCVPTQEWYNNNNGSITDYISFSDRSGLSDFA